MHKVILSKKVSKELEKIPKLYYIKVIEVLKSLESDPYVGKRLKGEFSQLFVIRAWPYRIVYEIYKNELIVQIIKINHRKDVYK